MGPAVVGVLVLLAGCAGGGAPAGPITIDGGAGLVRIRGLGSTTIVAVYAAPEFDSTLTPLAGDWERRGLTLEFRPRFSPAAGLPLWVRIDTARMAGRVGAPLVRRIEPSASGADSAPPVRVTIHPATDTVPENMLRWYLEFSAPMHRGDALNHLTLLDEKGRQVEGAFLDLSEELWDPSGTRLTVLFDPGRVKRGIRTNLESGRPVVAGHRYALRIDGGWRDRRARPLGAPTEKRFFATTADYRGPDPDGWSLRVPEIGTRDPLEIGFGEPLDHALATRLIAVIDGRGRPVEGEVSLDEAGTRWRLSPVNPWFGERYQIAVSAELEDLAGNRPGRAFDQDVAAEQRPDSDGGQRVRSFFPVRGKRGS